MAPALSVTPPGTSHHFHTGNRHVSVSLGFRKTVPQISIACVPAKSLVSDSLRSGGL